MAKLKAALAQVNVVVGDLLGNQARILESVAEARKAGADIVTFPELALCGYPPEDLLLKPRFLRDCRVVLDELAGKVAGITAVVGFPQAGNGRARRNGNGKVYNAAAVIRDGAVGHVYRKIELPNYGVFDEKRYFAPGSGAVVFEAAGVPVSVTICEDIWVEQGPAETQARKSGCRVLLNLSASPFHAGKLAARREVAAALAARLGAFICYNNLVGGQDELVFDGGSMVLDARGQLIAAAKRFEEDLLVAELELDESAPQPAVAAADAGADLDAAEEVHRALVLGTRDYVRKNGFTKAVIGLSGGVDSSVTAAIAVDALGPSNVIGVSMPSRHTSAETFSDASLVAVNLGIALLTVPIEPVLAMYLEALREAFGPGPPGIETENLQARIRGNILMALSNRFGWIVLTTGNKSEIATGYCTLYGDMAGGFAVIKDVPKMMVYALARRINDKAKREVIPRSVLVRAPTAELKPNQKDTDTLPPYPVLDRVLQLYVEADAAPDDLTGTGFSRAVVEKVMRMVDGSEYKRRQAPPGIKITPKAFGRDRRLPITNRYKPLELLR